MSQLSKQILTGTACLIAGAAIGNYLPFSFNPTAMAVSDMKLDQKIESFIRKNPEVIVESLQDLQRKAFEERQQAKLDAVADHLEAIQDSSVSPSVGTGESGIILVEFFDYHCGYCKKAASAVRKVHETHPDVKIVFKEFPILSKNSRLAAEAALAVSKLAPAKYYEFHDLLMAHTGEYNDESLGKMVEKIGVTLDALKTEMKTEWVAKEIQTVSDLAEAVGITGTPAIVIGGELIPGAVPFAELDRRIKALKAEKKEAE